MTDTPFNGTIKLKSAAVDGQTLGFTYNEDGIRTSKTVNGVTTAYYLNGSQILAEETNGNVTLYVYDASGSPIGMQYHGADYAEGVWDVYWFDKNLQGDIVGIYNQAGMQLASYKYNAWGTVYETYLNGGADTSAAKNPFLYRGYYYDRELDMYYLGARYYDPAICRFISPDSINLLLTNPTLLTDKNLYAYCDNNPVTRVDDGGEFWNYVIGGAVGFGAGLLTSFLTELALKEHTMDSYQFWCHVGVGALAGCAGGVLAASGLGLGAQVALNSMLGVTTSVADNLIDGETDWGTYVMDATDGAFSGAVSGLLGGEGTQSKHVTNSWKRLTKNKNFSYFYSQISNQSKLDGLKAIPGILKSNIPSALESLISINTKYRWC